MYGGVLAADSEGAPTSPEKALDTDVSTKPKDESDCTTSSKASTADLLPESDSFWDFSLGFADRARRSQAGR